MTTDRVKRPVNDATALALEQISLIGIAWGIERRNVVRIGARHTGASRQEQHGEEGGDFHSGDYLGAEPQTAKTFPRVTNGSARSNCNLQTV